VEWAAEEEGEGRRMVGSAVREIVVVGKREGE